MYSMHLDQYLAQSRGSGTFVDWMSTRWCCPSYVLLLLSGLISYTISSYNEKLTISHIYYNVFFSPLWNYVPVTQMSWPYSAYAIFLVSPDFSCCCSFSLECPHSFVQMQISTQESTQASYRLWGLPGKFRPFPGLPEQYVCNFITDKIYLSSSSLWS